MKKYIIIFGLCLTACNTTEKSFWEGFDTQSWQADANACEGQRAKLLDDFNRKMKQKLKGKSETVLIEGLGRPDRTELSKRNQKFYFYFVEKGAQCDSTLPDNARRLSIRFDALGKINEIVTVRAR
jgi:hypothetical protein